MLLKVHIEYRYDWQIVFEIKMDIKCILIFKALVDTKTYTEVLK